MSAQKDALIDKMIDNPLDFTEKDLQLLVSLENEKGEKEVTFPDLRNNILRIYDMNEHSLVDASNPMTGGLKKSNEWSTKKRKKRYFKKIRNHFTLDPANRIIVAEGDSWFQFPFFIKDIIDWLMQDNNLAIYSIAAGGDWMANMIYEGKYIEELSIHKPHVFLISGGGNDFIGGNRISVMIDKEESLPKYKNETALRDACGYYNISDEEVKWFLQIQKHINKEFYAFIWTLKTQYLILFTNLKRSGKFSQMRIITQGYDNVIPSAKNRWSWRYPMEYFVNKFVNTGQWLKQPIQIKGFNEGNTQQWIMRYLIFEVNQMFIDLATRQQVTAEGKKEFMFPNVYHIDCRHIAKGFKDWFDEIHLKSHRFKIISKAYRHVINGSDNFDPGKKIIKAIDFDE
jgi:hypothetical protein